MSGVTVTLTDLQRQVVLRALERAAAEWEADAALLTDRRPEDCKVAALVADKITRKHDRGRTTR